ncbi:hypothetical protein MNBD_CHLOROFLEXI01-2297 [hydrothermal vent metagenome]|uniref:Uncharacterized protein n=1 Tax=hydrothermal vent metagenome TaxID=652676 RepID=A0A3B0WAC7_9ZZZZ
MKTKIKNLTTLLLPIAIAILVAIPQGFMPGTG